MKDQCKHNEGKTPSWDYVTCKKCGSIHTGNHEDTWGIAKNKWFKNTSEARFYKENGRYPE